MKPSHLVVIAAAALGTAPLLAQSASTQPPRPAPSTAPSTAPASADASAAPTDPGEERVCRNERVTGSLTRVNRICMTRNEWAALANRTREDVDRAIRPNQAGQVCTGPSC